jgi:hypothetical protein
MSEMIERVARAAYFAGEGIDARGAFSSANDAHWAHWWQEDRELHEAMARAAIEAMREPTKEMMSAMYRRNDDNDSEQATLENWQAAIEAALTG